MKILLFSGNSDGRQLSRALADLGFAVTVSVATDYGAEEQGHHPHITTWVGRKSTQEIAQFLPLFSLCIDATHPYALEITQNIAAACAQTGVRNLRLVRSPSDSATAITLDSVSAAAQWLGDREGNILLTTGSKELDGFSSLPPQRLFPRVLPSVESITACQNLGIPRRNIIAMQGPFSQALNAAMMRQLEIRYLVTKDGGTAGGFGEKLSAAQEVGVTTIVIRRPAELGHSMDEILHICKGMIL